MGDFLMCLGKWIEAHQSLAAWIQAIFSIVAIGAVGVASIYQSKTQHRSAMLVSSLEHKESARKITEAVYAISRAASNAMAHACKSLNSRQAIFWIVEGRDYFHKSAVSDQERNLKEIPLHSLPNENLIRLVVSQVSVANQFNNKIELVFKIHRNMEAADFEAFFKDLSDMSEVAEQFTQAIKAEINKYI